MGILEDARELAKTIPITDEMQALGEENIGMFADEETRLFYWDRGTRFLAGPLTPEIIAASLNYRVEWKTTPIAAEASAPLGVSKFRGSPHLPPGYEWPQGLLFAAQLNLAEFSKYDPLDYLPETGMLYLFFGSDGSEEVHYYDGPLESLEITNYPEHVDLKYYGEFRKGSTLSFEPGFVFHIDTDDYDEFAQLVPDEFKTKLEALFGCKMKDDRDGEGFFGRPWWWQGEDELWPDEEPPEVDTLLCQFEFGEGHVHFWFDPSQGRRGDFSNAWVSYSGT